MALAKNITIIKPLNLNPTGHTTTHKKRVVAYVRVSTKYESQQTSFNAQYEYYKELIERDPTMEFCGIYADEGISGRSMKKRKEFRRMVDDGINGKFDLILVKSVSRFARNVVDCLNVVKQLKDSGVEIRFEKEGLSSFANDKATNFQLTIFSTIAQEESESLSDSVNWGIKRRNEKGVVKANKVYGYDIGKDKNFVINPAEAEIVRAIFRMYLDGATYNGIATILDRNGVKPPKSKKGWSDSTICKMLVNEKYIGDALLQKSITETYKAKRRPRSGDNQQYYVADHHEPIIDRETFERVKREIAYRESQRGFSPTGKSLCTSKYPFSNKLFCYGCGSKFRRHYQRTAKQGDISIWVCINHKNNGRDSCSQRPIKEKQLEEAFMRVLNRVVADGDVIIDDVLKSIDITLDGDINTGRVADLQAEIDAKQRQMLTLMSGKNGSIQAAEIQAKTMAIMEEIVNLTREKEEIEQKITAYEHNIERVAQLKELISKEKLLQEFNREIFRTMVEKVIIDGNEATFHFNGELKITEIVENK